MILKTDLPLYTADKQCRWQYALHFGLVQFPGRVENAQNVNFLKFRNVTISQIEYIVVIICGSCMLHSADKQSSLLFAIHFMFLTFLYKIKIVQMKCHFSDFWLGGLFD